MDLIFEFILIFVVYMIIMPAAYYVTEIKRPPKWLDWRPWNCRTCLSTWSLLFAYLGIGIAFDLWGFCIGGVILAGLTGIALYIDQKDKTIKIEDYGKLE